jgi:hypothetical protein
MSEADTVTAADVAGLNQAVVARAASLARRASTALLVVAGIGLLAWAWITLRGLGVLGDTFDDLGDPGFGVDERIDLVAGYTIVLVYSALTAGLAVALRLGADYSVARTGGSLTGVRTGEPLSAVRHRPPATAAADADT